MQRRGQTGGTITRCVTHYGHTAIPVGRLLGRLNFFRRFRVLRLPFFGCLLFVYPQSTFCDVFVVVCFYRIFLLLLLLLLLVVAGRKLHVFVIVWYSQGCCCQWVCFCHSFRLRFSVFRLVFCRTVTPDPLIFSIRLGFWKGVLARNFVLRQVLWIHTEIVHTKNRYSQRTLTMRSKTEKTLTHTHTTKNRWCWKWQIPMMMTTMVATKRESWGHPGSCSWYGRACRWRWRSCDWYCGGRWWCDDDAGYADDVGSCLVGLFGYSLLVMLDWCYWDGMFRDWMVSAYVL